MKKVHLYRPAAPVDILDQPREISDEPLLRVLQKASVEDCQRGMSSPEEINTGAPHRGFVCRITNCVYVITDR
jgi:hypothetical protein